MPLTWLDLTWWLAAHVWLRQEYDIIWHELDSHIFCGDLNVAKSRWSYKWWPRWISAVFHIAIQSRVLHRKNSCWISTFIFVRLSYYFLMVWPRCLRNRSNSAAHWSQHECISGRVWEGFISVNSLKYVTHVTLSGKRWTCRCEMTSFGHSLNK
jgi:hypothetical protein